ncbi:urease subunit gamma/beta [Kineosphaera limosa]|uniref:urease n=1 Tax=Kineosphaera limosa NBRC 100340 TaxID=1184609 RepID=K6X6W4_9MICO|nr:urease subunit gamma [Kineosphaera limosa]NYD99449.1 urease subunit gamma/beta [Kineosphaera limosa]GAB94569.1 urease subunit gamma/beta [Kineosphaera limosa NBRC 100340]
MHLSPADTEKLLLAVAGMVARDRLARGVALNHPEAVALLSTWVIERAREGRGVADLMAAGRGVLTRDQVLPGVAEMIHDIQVEATFPDGRKLVTLHHPIGEPEAGEPAPHDDELYEFTPEFTPGQVRTVAGHIDLNADRGPAQRCTLTILNTGDRPVQLGSHLHLPDANSALEFDRDAAAGYRLDIPAGTSVRFEPGVSASVDCVALRGRRHVAGLQLREGN